MPCHYLFQMSISKHISMGLNPLSGYIFTCADPFYQEILVSRMYMYYSPQPLHFITYRTFIKNILTTHVMIRIYKIYKLNSMGLSSCRCMQVAVWSITMLTSWSKLYFYQFIFILRSRKIGKNEFYNVKEFRFLITPTSRKFWGHIGLAPPIHLSVLPSVCVGIYSRILRTAGPLIFHRWVGQKKRRHTFFSFLFSLALAELCPFM